MRAAATTAPLLFSVALLGCGAELPADLDGYAERCLRMNAEPIEPYDDDPHLGRKNVYACGVESDALVDNRRPFPDGAVIVKESTRIGEAFVWLVATARKQDGRWRWDEYTRNFADESFRRLPVGQSTCTDCHDGARSVDFIFTAYDR